MADEASTRDDAGPGFMILIAVVVGALIGAAIFAAAFFVRPVEPAPTGAPSGTTQAPTFAPTPAPTFAPTPTPTTTAAPSYTELKGTCYLAGYESPMLFVDDVAEPGCLSAKDDCQSRPKCLGVQENREKDLPSECALVFDHDMLDAADKDDGGNPLKNAFNLEMCNQRCKTEADACADPIKAARDDCVACGCWACEGTLKRCKDQCSASPLTNHCEGCGQCSTEHATCISSASCDYGLGEACETCQAGIEKACVANIEACLSGCQDNYYHKYSFEGTTYSASCTAMKGIPTAVPCNTRTSSEAGPITTDDSCVSAFDYVCYVLPQRHSPGPH